MPCNEAIKNYKLGRLFLIRSRVNRNKYLHYIHTSFNYFLKAAELGHADAQYRVGNSYTSLVNTDKEQEYKEALSKIDLENDPCFGEEYELRRIMRIKWLTKAAEQGHVDAMGDLGFMYYQETVFYENRKKSSYEKKMLFLNAVKWWMLAAKQGHSQAFYHIEWNLGKVSGMFEEAENYSRLFDKNKRLEKELEECRNAK